MHVLLPRRFYLVAFSCRHLVKGGNVLEVLGMDLRIALLTTQLTLGDCL